MKKLFAAVFLISIFAIAGCASDSSNSSAQAPAPETVTSPDANAPATLVGKYKVDYFAILDNNTTLLSNDCAYAKANDFSTYGGTCYDATILADLVDVQPHAENNGMLSFVIQMQLDSPEIRNGALKEHAYHHLLFPIQNAYLPVTDNDYLTTKATERGLTSFFIARPGGDQNNRNATLHYLRNFGEQIEIKLLYEKGPVMQYVYRLTKTSDVSNGYVQTKGDVNIQSGLYAISNIFNTLIQNTFGDETLDTLFGDFISDIPNEIGADVAQ